jgi:7,8-dihydropterin-6-yl-methyl-4-(beta-D-ribofuranosyl)aminobenzene 5'-phosphate synthase
MFSLLVTILIIISILLFFVILKFFQLNSGRKRVSKEIEEMRYNPISSLGSVKFFSILPLVDYYADRDGLKTEAGVAYLIRADDKTILMDVGFNIKGKHPSALLYNMNELGIRAGDIDLIFISHIHADHVGGIREQRNRTFSISRGMVNLGKIPIYAPGKLNPSKWNLGPRVEVISKPRIIGPGIASIGVIPRFLFLIGYTEEHSLAINVKGKGIILIIGCGHQTIERIIERTRMLFDEPIYGIIGGLHLPVNGGRAMIGPINIQMIIGSDRPPWKGLNENDVKRAIDVIKREDVQLISLSPHDSSDWSIEQFKNSFQERYIDLRIGKEIKI